MSTGNRAKQLEERRAKRNQKNREWNVNVLEHALFLLYIYKSLQIAGALIGLILLVGTVRTFFQ